MHSADGGRFPGQPGDYCVGVSGTCVLVSYEARGQTDQDRVAGVAARALDELQDYFDEATHHPWQGAWLVGDVSGTLEPPEGAIRR